MMVPIALCYCELVPMLPVAGGGMAFAYKAFNETVSFISGWAAFGAFVSIIPWEAIQITDVLGYLIPGIKTGPILYKVAGEPIYLITIIIGTVASLLLFALNMRGLAAAASVQKILCFILVGAAVIGAIASLIGGNADNWKPIYDVTDPTIYGNPADGLKQVSHNSMFGGILAILASAPFFLAGFETIPQGIEDAGGDVASVGKTVVLSVVLACVFYAILLFCFGYAWKWQEFAHMSNPSAATMFKSLYPGAVGGVLYWLITLGAIAGLFTTWNGFFMASASLLMAMGRGNLVPGVFAKQNKNGIPVPGLLVCLLLSLIGPFLGAGLIGSITSFSAAAFVLSWCITSFSLIRLRKIAPDMERPYKIPGGDGWLLCPDHHRGLHPALRAQQPRVHGQDRKHHVCGLDGHRLYPVCHLRRAEKGHLQGRSRSCDVWSRNTRGLILSSLSSIFYLARSGLFGPRRFYGGNRARCVDCACFLFLRLVE